MSDTMKRISQEEVEETLSTHEKYMNSRPAATRADFQNLDLTNIDLSDKFLGGLNFSGSNLSNANFHNVRLGYATLRGTNLTNANLKNADFFGADLTGVIMHGPEIMDVLNISHATIPEWLLPWLSCHEDFHIYAQGLIIAEDAVRDL